MAKGFIYVLSHPRMPGILKIGHTTRSIEERISELSNHTGVPGKFKLELQWKVDDSYLVEQKIHSRLKKERVNKEFFEISLLNAEKVIEGVIGYEHELLRNKLQKERDENLLRINKLDDFVKSGLGYQEYFIDLAKNNLRQRYVPLIYAWLDFRGLGSSSDLTAIVKSIEMLNICYSEVFPNKQAIDVKIFREDYLNKKKIAEENNLLKNKQILFNDESKRVNDWVSSLGEGGIGKAFWWVFLVFACGYIVTASLGHKSNAETVGVLLAALSSAYFIYKNYRIQKRKRLAELRIKEMHKEIFKENNYKVERTNELHEEPISMWFFYLIIVFFLGFLKMFRG